MIYLRRYPRSENNELHKWQAVSQAVAINIAKVVTPVDKRKDVPRKLIDLCFQFGNEFVQVLHCSEAYSKHLIGYTYAR